MEPELKRARCFPETSDIIDLDVGGTAFRSSKTTLRKAPFFEALFTHSSEEGMMGGRTAGGAIFVDRCPCLFKQVLEFLRTDICPRTRRGSVESDHLESEFKFYGLDPRTIDMWSEKVVTKPYYFVNMKESRVDPHIQSYLDKGWRVKKITSHGGGGDDDLMACTCVLEQ